MSATAVLAALVLAQAPTLEVDLENALGTAGLTTSSARFDPNLLRFFAGPGKPSPLFESSFENPWRMPFFIEAFRADLAAAGPSDSLNVGLRMLGYGTRRTLVGDPIQPAKDAAMKPGSLTAVLETMRGAGLYKNPTPSTGTVPIEVQQAAALILNQMLASVSWRRSAVRDLGSVDAAYNFVAMGLADGGGDAVQKGRDLEAKFDPQTMGVAAHDIQFAVTEAEKLIAKVPATQSYKFEVETTWGAIRLSGGTDDQYPDKPSLLVIDTGGADQYLNQPRNASASNWASVVIDLAGNDEYLSDPALKNVDVPSFADRKTGGSAPGPGGALFGIVALHDSAGNDLYRTHRAGIGSGRFGFASVHDLDGDDRYDAYKDSQGFGSFGAGILIDENGGDQYQALTQSQACGLPMGLGLLIDRGGNDIYLANASVVDFPSPQDAKQNVSLCQGAGYGRRADITDGKSVAGGIGWLIDTRGDDKYTCGVFGQGVGYWQGVGLLSDLSGKDEYSGQWYVQGAAAHFAIGYLEDAEGDDLYLAPLNMAQGAGHDFSIGFLMDKAGNDRYQSPNLSLGAGNANGIGIFIDALGNDNYQSSGLTLGKAAEALRGTLRARALTLGLFMDLQGTDTYPQGATWAGDARRVPNWQTKGDRISESQVGIFFDR